VVSTTLGRRLVNPRMPFCATGTGPRSEPLAGPHRCPSPLTENSVPGDIRVAVSDDFLSRERAGHGTFAGVADVGVLRAG
jgi:hypothetical protein